MYAECTIRNRLLNSNFVDTTIPLTQIFWKTKCLLDRYEDEFALILLLKENKVHAFLRLYRFDVGNAVSTTLKPDALAFILTYSKNQQSHIVCDTDSFYNRRPAVHACLKESVNKSWNSRPRNKRICAIM